MVETYRRGASVFGGRRLLGIVGLIFISISILHSHNSFLLLDSTFLFVSALNLDYISREIIHNEARKQRCDCAVGGVPCGSTCYTESAGRDGEL